VKSLIRILNIIPLCILAGNVLLGDATPIQQAPARTGSAANPLAGNDRARRAGAKLFARECATCHGSGAEGSGRALPLIALEVRDAPPGALFWVLTNGSLRKRYAIVRAPARGATLANN
jgi:mono/diheme cytochrome c family protein